MEMCTEGTIFMVSLMEKVNITGQMAPATKVNS